MTLQLNGRNYSLDQLKASDFHPPTTPFEQATLEFSHDWLIGKENFTLFTSGSTGTPKKITASRRAMEASAQATALALRLKEGDTALVNLDTHFIAGKMMLVRCFVTGMNCIALDPVANPLEKIPGSVKIDFAAFVPYQLRAIINSEDTKKRLQELKAVIVGGAALDSKTKSQLVDITPSVYATYGMTETLSHIALQKLNPPAAEDFFRTLPGVAIQQDHRGCLVIRADYLADALITNDIVEILSTGTFRWLGRWDNIINTGGVKVMPEKIEQEIEKALMEIGVACRFFVTGLPNEALGHQVTLIVEGALSPALRSTLMERLSALLSVYEVPREIRSVARFIETHTQKINRKETLKLI